MSAAPSSLCLPLLLLLLPPLLASAQAWLGDLGGLLQDCPRGAERPLLALASCARRRAVRAIDRILDDDDIPLADGLDLVRLRPAGQRNRTLTSDLRDLLKRIREREADGGGGGREPQQKEEEEDWRAKLIKRLARVLKTHAIKIDLERTTGVTTTTTATTPSRSQVEARGRRRRRRQMQMMPIIMMGVLLMGSVLIPMGFQFLAVLGGKALLLAKMALMLSSIQGLKKIATNGVNYGLYHSPLPAAAEPWHERSTAGAAGIDLPSYALGYSGHGGPGFSPHSAPGYLEPATTYLTNRRSAST